MKIIVPNKVKKFLEKQEKGDIRGVTKVVRFLMSDLSNAQNPASLPNAKKMRGYSKQSDNIWRWRVGQYRIIGDVKENELLIYIIEISTRENAY